MKSVRSVGSKRKQGFTLIELLIVVAIIAILAAIAVPNFLEAMIRSKVSRLKSDLRSLAVAVEAYTVDYNKYPGDARGGDSWAASPGRVPFPQWDWNMVQVTTPTAYITSIPEDPFVIASNAYPTDLHTWYYTKTGYGSREEGYFGASGMNTFSPPRDVYDWAFVCPGPDLYYEYDRLRGRTDPLNTTAGRPQGLLTYYDPTNGSKSMGDIWYLGSGGGFNPAPQPSP